MKRLVHLVLLVLLAAPALAAPRKEVLAWTRVEAAEDLAEQVELAEAFLQEFPDSEHELEVRLLAGHGCLSLERWAAARRHFEQYLKGSGPDVASARFGLGVALARQGALEAARSNLERTASDDPDPVRAARAARELVQALLEAGEWKLALEAQLPLIARGLFQQMPDLDDARRAGAALSAEALEQLETLRADGALAPLVALLRLDRQGGLGGGPAAAAARSAYRARYGGSALVELLPDDGGALPPDDSDPHRIGVLLPASGRYAAPGKLVRAALEIALQALQEGDPELTFVWEDTGSDPAQAAAGLRRLATEERVVAVLGPLIAEEAEAVAPEAALLGVPTVLLTQRQGLAGHPMLFNAGATPEEQLDALADAAVGPLALPQVAIAYPATEAGAARAARFWDRVEQRGGRVAAVISYPPEQTDFTTLAPALLGKELAEKDRVLPFLPGRLPPQASTPVTAGVDFAAVFVPDSYKRASMIGPGLKHGEVNIGGNLDTRTYPAVVLLGPASLNHPDFIARAPDTANGAIIADPFFARAEDPGVAAFMAAWKRVSKEDPTLLEASAWDAALIVAQALRGGVTGRAELAVRLATLAPEATSTAATGFGGDGELRHAVRLLRVRKGRLELWTAPEAPPETPITP